MPADAVPGGQQDAEPCVQFMIVSVGDVRYAVQGDDIREVAHDVKVQELPFVPPCIEGVINWRGVPCAVLNPLSLLEGSDEPVSGATFLLFKGKDFCLHITTAETFLPVPQKELPVTTVNFRGQPVRVIAPGDIEDAAAHLKENKENGDPNGE